MICVICGQDMFCKIGEYHYKESGLDDVYLSNVRICTCNTCREQIVCIPKMPQLHQVIAEYLLEKPSKLNGKEIRFLRKNIGLKAIQLKDYLKVDNSTISRWEHNQQEISAPHDVLFRMVYAYIKGVTPDKIKSMMENAFARIAPDNPTPPLFIDLSKLSNQCLLPV